MLRRAAYGAALACFAFVAWSWTELHELMQADPVWRELYAAGHRVFVAGTIAPRLVVAFAGMTTLFATLAAWSAGPEDRKRLAWVAIVSRVAAVGGAVWLWRAGFVVDGPARAWLGVLGAAAVIDGATWLIATRRPSDRVLAVATAAGTAALVAAVVVREAPRIALVEQGPEAGGGVVFAVAIVIGIAAIAWIVRTVRA
jgi:hypothetical protein